MADEPKKALAPELEEVVKAGDTLVITDSKGKEFAITGRDSDEVIEFCVAFDDWLSARNSGVPITEPLLQSLMTLAISKFNELPNRIVWQMPSYKALRANVGVPVKRSH